MEEAEAVLRSRSQFVTLKRVQNIKYLPHAFTEHGAIMAATVFKRRPTCSVCWTPSRRVRDHSFIGSE
jgi:hypothetical protein